ncbi:MAG: EI24 domain-containing protein [Nonlabens sp.]
MIKNIFKGLSAYSKTFGLISKLGLWKYFLIPMTISLLIAVAVFLSIYKLADNIGRWIASLWPWETGFETVTAISTFVGGLAILVLGFILYKHIVMALSSPFMSPVSEKMERHLFPEFYQNIKQRKTSNTEQLVRGLRINLRNLIYELLITIPLLILSLIPVVNFVTTPLIFLVQSYYAGFGNMDYTLERHFNYKESVSFVKKSRGYAIGNGIVFTLLALIPVIGVIIVLPISATAASKTTLELLRERKVLQENNPGVNLKNPQPNDLR